MPRKIALVYANDSIYYYNTDSEEQLIKPKYATTITILLC